MSDSLDYLYTFTGKAIAVRLDEKLHNKAMRFLYKYMLVNKHMFSLFPVIPMAEATVSALACYTANVAFCHLYTCFTLDLLYSHAYTLIHYLLMYILTFRYTWQYMYRLS